MLGKEPTRRTLTKPNKTMTKEEAYSLATEKEATSIATNFLNLRTSQRQNGYTNDNWFLVPALLRKKEEKVANEDESWTVLAFNRKDLPVNPEDFTLSGKGFDLLNQNTRVSISQKSIGDDVVWVYETLT